MSLVSRLINLGAAGAGGADSAWIAELNNTYNGGTYIELRDAAVDDSGNVFVGGYTPSTGSYSNNWIMAKFDIDGNHAWTKVQGNSSFVDCRGVAVLSNGNPVFAGNTYGSSSRDDGLLFLNSSNGAVTAQRAWDRSGGVSGIDRVFVPSGTSDIYTTGYFEPADYFTGSSLKKFNSDGSSITYDKSLDASVDDGGKDVTVDSSGNVIVCGYSNNFGSYGGLCLVTKVNSSFTQQWTRSYETTGSNRFNGVATDSSDNIYLAGETQSPGNYAILFKFNSSGTLQWQKYLTSSQKWLDVTVDADDYIYAVGHLSEQSIRVAKYNPSGNVEWQQSITYSTRGIGYSINATSKSIIITAEIGPSARRGTTFKLPQDGSITGTYGNYTIANVSGTNANSSLSSAGSIWTLTNTGFNSQTGALNTGNTNNVTASLTTIA